MIKIISLVFPDEASDEISLETLYEKAKSNNQAIKRKLEHGALIIPPNSDASTNSEITSNWKRADFESAVDEIKELIAAGESIGDRAWQMPLWDDYQKSLDSNFADMANIGSPGGGH